MRTPILMRPDAVPNRFLRDEDWSDPRFGALREEFERLYRSLGGRPHPYGSTDPSSVVIHWSREWEYPWAVLNAELEPSMRVVDLGCGGSPLLMYLQREWGCTCVGVDTRLSAGTHYDLRTFPRDPRTLHPEIDWRERGMDDLNLPDAWADRVFCISVLEHVGSDVAMRTMREIRRVLAPAGLAVITTDADGEHRTLTSTHGQLLEMALESGLELAGEADLTPRQSSRGSYAVVGFRLRART